MISKSTIDTIFNTARVEEVIGDFVQLKRSGSSLKGLSPFSEEKSPSFMVSPAKQIWKDFSSGKGGNVVTFLMELEQFSYPEALRWLAKRYNIEIEEEGERSEQELENEKTKESLFILTEFAKKFFIEQLHNSEEGQNIGLSYFKERGFNQETIKKFELGYSPSSWTAFADYAEGKGYSPKLLEQAGLVNYREDGRKADKFRERVIFPIYSYSGRALGFGGRTLRSDKNLAKYLNSPETEIYHKSKTLYGLFQAKQAILKNDNCILVEGYTDVLSLHQSGIEHVVASSGTALTKEQIRLIKRLTNNITLIYDGDAAGIKASFRGIDLILEQELNIKILLLPDGDDPDSFAKKLSTSQIKEYLEAHATDFISFKAKVLLKDAKDDPVKKAELIREMIYSIALIPNIIQRELYVMETSRIMDIREEVLYKELAQQLNKGAVPPDKPTTKKGNLSVVPTDYRKEVVDQYQLIEEEIIRLIMQHGDVIVSLRDENNELYETTVIDEILRQFEDNELQMSNPFYQKILDEVLIGYNQDELRTGSFFSKLMDEKMTSTATEMMMDPYSISDNWKLKQGINTKRIEDSISKDVFDILLRFKYLHVDKSILKILDITKGPDFTGEVRQELMQEVMELTKMKMVLNRFLNRVI